MNTPPLTKWSLVAGFLFVGLLGPTAASAETSIAAARESIVSADLSQHVEALADDTLEGRQAGSRGGRAAGTYIVHYLKKLGLTGAADRGRYYQNLPSGGRNILAILPGSDEMLKTEVVVVGAHYDHVGYGNSSNSYGPYGRIHNGADDNASGTSGLIELAEAITKMPTAPRRTILFAWWDGEEQGLLGSKHWVASPTLPLKRIVMKINLDMIGRLRNDHLRILGSRTTSGIRSLVSQSNDVSKLNINFEWKLESNSDHYSFIAAGIPSIMFHTGLHSDYHRPSDDAHKVNADGMQRVVRLLFDTTLQIANRDQSTRFRRAALRENTEDARRQFERPLRDRSGRLGIRWRPIQDGAVNPSLIVTRVIPGSAADQGGIRVGDQIIQFANRPVTDDTAFIATVLAAQNPVQVEVRRVEASDPFMLSLNLSGNPVRVGMAWRQDAADPHSMLLVQVTRGSPADRSGLRVGDRIYRVAGNRLRDSDHLLDLANRLESPLDILVERRGRLRNVSLLHLPPLANPSESAGDPQVPATSQPQR